MVTLQVSTAASCFLKYNGLEKVEDVYIRLLILYWCLYFIISHFPTFFSSKGPHCDLKMVTPSDWSLTPDLASDWLISEITLNHIHS